MLLCAGLSRNGEEALNSSEQLTDFEKLHHERDHEAGCDDQFVKCEAIAFRRGHTQAYVGKTKTPRYGASAAGQVSGPMVRELARHAKTYPTLRRWQMSAAEMIVKTVPANGRACLA